MRNLWGWIVGIIVIAAIIIGVVAASGNDNKNNTNTTPPPSSNNTNPNPSPTANQNSTSTDKVTIENMSFSPTKITVKKGTTVTWTNNDSTTHTVTADSGTGPNSGDLSPGKTYSFTYNSTGTFDYHCTIHPNMTASVTVTE